MTCYFITSYIMLLYALFDERASRSLKDTPRSCSAVKLKNHSTGTDVALETSDASTLFADNL